MGLERVDGPPQAGRNYLANSQLHSSRRISVSGIEQAKSSSTAGRVSGNVARCMAHRRRDLGNPTENNFTRAMLQKPAIHTHAKARLIRGSVRAIFLNKRGEGPKEGQPFALN